MRSFPIQIRTTNLSRPANLIDPQNLGNVPVWVASNLAGRRIRMDDRPTITLHYVQKDGKRERTRLTHHTMAEARQVAKAMLHLGHGLYTEVDICAEGGPIETIQNAAVACPSWDDLRITGNHLARKVANR